jgi:hypothetical protein
VTRFVVDCETLLRIASGVALTQLQADAFVTSDRELAQTVSGLVETATIDALQSSGGRSVG